MIFDEYAGRVAPPRRGDDLKTSFILYFYKILENTSEINFFLESWNSIECICVGILNIAILYEHDLFTMDCDYPAISHRSVIMKRYNHLKEIAASYTTSKQDINQ